MLFERAITDSFKGGKKRMHAAKVVVPQRENLGRNPHVHLRIENSIHSLIGDEHLYQRTVRSFRVKADWPARSRGLLGPVQHACCWSMMPFPILPLPLAGKRTEVAMDATAPSQESARVAALDRYAILDTEPEQTFDDLVILAAYICKTPIAMLSLVDEHRQWFKSKVGVQIRETPKETSFCAHAIQQEDLFIVPDTLKDPRFKDNPMVLGEPHIRFYTGAPIVNEDGFALGTLCVIDRQPRELDSEQKEALWALSRLALGQMELRQNLQLLKEALNDRTREEHAREKELKRLEEKLVRVLGLNL